MLLEVSQLTVRYPHGSKTRPAAIRGASFAVDTGEVVGLLGESGCGKSTMGLAIMGLLPGGTEVDGSIRLDGTEICGAPNTTMRSIRGARVSIVFQEPKAALHPLLTVGDQVTEVIRAHHQDWPPARCRLEARKAMGKAGLDDGCFNSYPHQLSGGQMQRVLIAQALACSPAVLIADEPTASLDSVTQAEILRLFRTLKADTGLGILMITHHPGTLRQLADRILVMYAGQIVEAGSVEQVLENPMHPYTKGLLRSVPPPPGCAKKRLPALIPDGQDWAGVSTGCAFAPRCPVRLEECRRQAPMEIDLPSCHQVRCLLYAK